jgi:flagellar hook-associated protein FlgK
MKKPSRVNTTNEIRTRIIWISGLTLVLSLGAMIFILWFQRSPWGSGIWDFQGAVGAATVVPAFSGVVLAAWAIAIQVKTNSPSYKAAEQKWLEIYDLYYRILKVGSVVLPLNLDKDSDSGASEDEPDFSDSDQSPSKYDDLFQRIYAAKNIHLQRCMQEFKPQRDQSAVSNINALAIRVLPVLETLQYQITSEEIENIISLETKIDELGSAFDINDFDEKKAWVIDASDVISRIYFLIDQLETAQMLNLDAIQNALLSPHQSQSVRDWFTDLNERAKIKTELRSRQSPAREALRQKLAAMCTK